MMFMTAEEIGLDEPFSIYQAQFEVPVILDHLKHYNNPPLFEILLHYWIKLFGISAFSVRLLPVLLASLCPLALYYLATRHFSLRIAIFSSLMLSFSSLLLYYAHDCRVYSLFVLLGILSMNFYLSIVPSHANKRNLLKEVSYVFSTVLLIYAHYFGFFIILVQIAHVLIFRRERLLKTGSLLVIVLICYLPHLLHLYRRFTHSVSGGTWIDPPAGLESIYNAFWAYSNFPIVTVTCIIVLLAATFKWLVVKRQRPPGNLTAIILWFLVPVAGMFIISYAVPMYINRYLIYGLPAYYICVCTALMSLFENQRLQIALLVFITAGLAVTLELNPDKKQPLRELVSTVRAAKKAETLVIVNPFDLITAFAYHYDEAAFRSVHDQREYHDTDSLLRTGNVFLVKDETLIRKALSHQKRDILYVVQGAHRALPSNGIYRLLCDSLKIKWKKVLGSNHLVIAFN
jgi:mannosyltransferase